MSQSPPVPKHVGPNKMRGGGGGYSPLIKPGGAPEIVSARPYNVQVGFNAPQRQLSLETTDPSTLPGTAEVITSPPKPHPPRSPVSKATSIEEVDKARRHYAPTSEGEGRRGGGGGGGRGGRSKSLDEGQRRKSPEMNGSSFCLGLPSLREYVTPPTSSERSTQSMYVGREVEGGWSVIESKPRSLSFEMRDVVSDCMTLWSCYV